MKKLISELPILGLGIGGALAGVSIAAIGADAVRKNFIAAGGLMAGGSWLAYVASQVAIGAVERVRGIR